MALHPILKEQLSKVRKLEYSDRVEYRITLSGSSFEEKGYVFTEEALFMLKELFQGCPGVTRLHIQGYEFTEEVFGKMLAFLKTTTLPDLELLEFQKGRFTVKMGQAVADYLLDNHYIKKFELSHSRVTDQVMEPIVKAFQRGITLKKVSFYDNSYTEKTSRAIFATLAFNTTLKDLEMDTHFSFCGFCEDPWIEGILKYNYTLRRGNLSSETDCPCGYWNSGRFVLPRKSHHEVTKIKKEVQDISLLKRCALIAKFNQLDSSVIPKVTRVAYDLD